MNQVSCRTKSQLLARVLEHIKMAHSTGRSLIIRRYFAEGRKLIQPETEPTLKFSETAAYVPRKVRPYPTALPLTFWEGMDSKQGSYQKINRFSFMASILAFGIYFMVLREENDLDEELNKPLWQRLPSLEEQVLHERIIMGKQRGEDVSKHEMRYNQLQEMKKAEQERLLRQQRRL